MLTIQLTNVEPAFAFLLLYAQLDVDYVRILQVEGDVLLVSQPDGQWRYSLDAEQPPDWKLPDFNDSGWRSLVERPMNPRKNYYSDHLAQFTDPYFERGAVNLGIDPNDPIEGKSIQALIDVEETLPLVSVRRRFAVQKRSEE